MLSIIVSFFFFFFFLLVSVDYSLAIEAWLACMILADFKSIII